VLSNSATPTTFSAPNLDVGLVEANVENILYVTYQ
jgi:hypothetical protein